MSGLGETIAHLTRLRQQAASSYAQGGETWMAETQNFGANPGALRMLSYVPEDLAPGSPLVVVLHGCTQHAEAFAVAAGWLELADRFGFAVLAPEQVTTNNGNRCFNWFVPQDTARGGGEAASIRAMVEHMVRSHDLDRRRVFVTGLSAGGAMTSVMLATYPDTFAAGAVVAGLPYGVAGNLQQALGAMHGGKLRDAADLGRLVSAAAPRGSRVPRIAIWHGDADTTVQPDNAVEIAKQWAAVQGLPAEPAEVEALQGRTRALWRNAEGEVVIESNLISGFGHGTPLATGGEDGVGTVAPYMLESGVSSSLEIARFWGIAGKAKPAAKAPRVRKAATASAATPPEAAASAIGQTVMASVSPHVPAEVEAVISGALRQAGLMK